MPARRNATAGWAVAVGLAVIYLLSTLPTPLYVIYQKQFGFSQITLTLVYAAYVIGTVLTMLFLGTLSDQIGRKKVVLASLGLAAGAAVVFLLARSTPWLFPARVVSGLSMALASGASTAWIVELAGKGRGTRMSIGATDFGLALGSLLAGVLTQFAPSPLRLVYWVFLALLAPAALLVWRAPETAEEKPLEEASLTPQLGVPPDRRGKFVAPALGAFAAFSVLGFYTALIPTLLSKELHQESHALAGLVVALLFAFGILGIAFKPALPDRTGLLTALALLLPSVGLLLAAESMKSLPMLFAATVIGGYATGLGYRSSLQAVNALVPDEERSGIVSAHLIACYCGISLPVIGIGLLAQVTTPLVADAVFAGVISAAAVVALIVEARVGAKGAPGERRAA
jgi:MFS family permease